MLSPLLAKIALHDFETFVSRNGRKHRVVLIRYEDMPITRHIKVRGHKSPGACPEHRRRDGDWVYWGARLGRDPTKPKRVIRLLRQQQGRCPRCGLRFTAADVLEVHHRDGHHNNNRPANLVLLHAHCHDAAHGQRCE